MAKEDKVTNVGTKQSTGVSPWAERLEQEAVALSKDIALGAASISTKGGLMKVGKDAIPGNKFLCCIIFDTGYNALYEGKYKEGEVSEPVCYGFGNSDSEMRPHECCKAPVTPECSSCPNNQWGSSGTGAGKKCSNKRRLGLVILGRWENNAYTIIENEAAYKDQVYILNVPATSLTAFNKYKKEVATVTKLPLYAVITEVECEPGSPFKFKFTLNDKVGMDETGNPLVDYDAIMSTIVERRFEVQNIVQRPYEFADSDKDVDTSKAKY